MRLALLGSVAGVIGALLLTRLMARMLYGVGATDLTTFAATSVLLLAVAAVASWVPARRATRIDPLHALRSD
jgi:putative ABC transport system permease protein